MKVQIHLPEGYREFSNFEIHFENVREADRFMTAITKAWESGFSQVETLDESLVFVFVKDYQPVIDEKKMLKETGKA